MLTEIIEFSRKMKEEIKAIQSEIKENIQGNNSEGKESGTQTNYLKQKGDMNNQNGMKKQEFKTMRRGLGTSGTTLSTPTSK